MPWVHTTNYSKCQKTSSRYLTAIPASPNLTSRRHFKIQAEAESRELLTIDIHRGLHQFSQLPFGAKTATVIFQQIMDTSLFGFPAKSAHSDVSDCRQLLGWIKGAGRSSNRTQDGGFRLRTDKCQFSYQLSNTRSSGMILPATNPDPEKI